MPRAGDRDDLGRGGYQCRGAANLVERMEREGIIGSANAMGKREVFGRKPDEE